MTLSDSQRALVAAVVGTYRGVGPKAVLREPIPPVHLGPGTPICGPSAPRRFARCCLCGAPGGLVCDSHADLLANDTSRAPELYLNTTGSPAHPVRGVAGLPTGGV